MGGHLSMGHHQHCQSNNHPPSTMVTIPKRDSNANGSRQRQPQKQQYHKRQSNIGKRNLEEIQSSSPEAVLTEPASMKHAAVRRPAVLSEGKQSCDGETKRSKDNIGDAGMRRRGTKPTSSSHRVGVVDEEGKATSKRRCHAQECPTTRPQPMITRRCRNNRLSAQKTSVQQRTVNNDSAQSNRSQVSGKRTLKITKTTSKRRQQTTEEADKSPAPVLSMATTSPTTLAREQLSSDPSNTDFSDPVPLGLQGQASENVIATTTKDPGTLLKIKLSPTFSMNSLSTTTMTPVTGMSGVGRKYRHQKPKSCCDLPTATVEIPKAKSTIRCTSCRSVTPGSQHIVTSPDHITHFFSTNEHDLTDYDVMSEAYVTMTSSSDSNVLVPGCGRNQTRNLQKMSSTAIATSMATTKHQMEASDSCSQTDVSLAPTSPLVIGSCWHVPAASSETADKLVDKATSTSDVKRLPSKHDGGDDFSTQTDDGEKSSRGRSAAVLNAGSNCRIMSRSSDSDDIGFTDDDFTSSDCRIPSSMRSLTRRKRKYQRIFRSAGVNTTSDQDHAASLAQSAIVCCASRCTIRLPLTFELLPSVVIRYDNDDNKKPVSSPFVISQQLNHQPVQVTCGFNKSGVGYEDEDIAETTTHAVTDEIDFKQLVDWVQVHTRHLTNRNNSVFKQIFERVDTLLSKMNAICNWFNISVNTAMETRLLLAQERILRHVEAKFSCQLSDFETICSSKLANSESKIRGLKYKLQHHQLLESSCRLQADQQQERKSMCQCRSEINADRDLNGNRTEVNEVAVQTSFNLKPIFKDCTHQMSKEHLEREVESLHTTLQMKLDELGALRIKHNELVNKLELYDNLNERSQLIQQRNEELQELLKLKEEKERQDEISKAKLAKQCEREYKEKCLLMTRNDELLFKLLQSQAEIKDVFNTSAPATSSSPTKANNHV